MANTTAKNEIQIFCYKSMPVRTVELDGDTWFVAKDVCDILEIVNSRDAISNLDDDEKGVAKTDTPGGMQDMAIISEAGLYALLMRSNKPEAKPFRRWVTHDVLPSIRKTGSYTAPSICEKPEKKSHLSVAWVKAVSKIIDMAFRAQAEEDFQKVIALDRVFEAETSYSALKSAGIKLNTKTEKETSFGIRHGEYGKTLVGTKFTYSFEWTHNLPKLPEDCIVSLFPYSDEELIAKGLLREGQW